jgi:hypothetical protein
VAHPITKRRVDFQADLRRRLVSIAPSFPRRTLRLRRTIFGTRSALAFAEYAYQDRRQMLAFWFAQQQVHVIGCRGTFRRDPPS